MANQKKMANKSGELSHGKEKKRMNETNRNAITLEDCIDNFEKKGEAAVIFDGQVVDFIKEK